MKITHVDTVLLRVPLQQRTITDSQSTVTHVEFLQVVLKTDAGLTGYGMNWSYTPGLRTAQIAVQENYAPVLLGKDPAFRKQITRECFFTRSWSALDKASQLRFENTKISGMIRWPVRLYTLLTV